MKRSAVFAAAVFAFSALGVVHAHENMKDMDAMMKKRSEQRFETLNKRLKLTTDQQSKVKTILDQNHEKMKAAHEECFQKHKAIREEGDTAIRATLTPDQQKEFDKLQAEMKEKHQKMHQEMLEKRMGHGGDEADDGPEAH